MHAYIGIFQDHNYASHSLEHHGELFADLADAKDKLERRYELGRCDSTRPVLEDGIVVDEIDGPEVDYPGVSEDASIALYQLHTVDSDEETSAPGDYTHGVVALAHFDEDDEVEAVFVD